MPLLQELAPEVESELDGYFTVPHDAPPKWLLMLYAYLDETGQESKDWVFIAGFLGNEDQWRKFDPKWKEGLGKRQSLHLKELRFKKDRERRMLERLGPLPVSCGLEPVIGGIRVSDYEDLLGGNTFLEQLGCGYLSALQPLLIQVLKWLPANERLELVLEQQNRYSWLTDFALRHIAPLPLPFMRTSDGRPKLASWRYVTPESTSLTEPADYFAHALLQYHRDPKSLKTQWCMPILNSANHVGAIGAVMTRAQARQSVTDLLAQLKQDSISMPSSMEEFERFRKRLTGEQ
jgi:hypothetical protein